MPSLAKWQLLLLMLVLPGCKHPSLRSASSASAPIAATAQEQSTPPCDLPEIRLRASAFVVLPGNPMTLTWSAERADRLAIQPDIGTVPLSGETQLRPSASVTYSATATG